MNHQLSIIIHTITASFKVGKGGIIRFNFVFNSFTKEEGNEYEKRSLLEG